MKKNVSHKQDVLFLRHPCVFTSINRLFVRIVLKLRHIWHIKCIKTGYVTISYLTCKLEIIRLNNLVPAKTWKFWYQIYMFKEVEKGEIELGNYDWPLYTWTYDNWGWWLERGFHNFILENIKNSAKVTKFIDLNLSKFL